MNTQDFLPENDIDLQLAKQLNSILESQGELSVIKDSLINSLIIFKNEELNSIKSLEVSTSEIWKSIDERTKPSKKAKITSLPQRRTNVWIWATAATVLIAAFLGMFWFTNLDQPKLVAQAGTKIDYVSLEDGSQITLRPHSSLFEILLSEKERTYKLEGEGFFEIAKDVDRPFTVQVAKGKITVLGTQFNVSTWGNETSVFLEEGSIRLDDENNNSAILNPGEKATITDSDIFKTSDANIKEFKDWLSNVIVVNRTPLDKVIVEIEHHFGITINLDQIDNKSELISGTIPLENLTTTLSDLEVILEGAFRKVNSDTFLFIPLN